MNRIFTRRVALAGAAVTAGVVLTACGSSGEPAGSTPGTGTSSSAASPAGDAGASFEKADVAFAQHMIPHHRQAVAMAALADTRATDLQVKKVAGQIKDAQDPEIITMTGWLTAWGQPAPDASAGGMDMGGMDMGGQAIPGMMSDADMKKLSAASGKDFDKQFLTMMIAHHKGAIDMAQDEVTNGKNPDATALAKQIITNQRAEIATMTTILAAL